MNFFQSLWQIVLDIKNKGSIFAPANEKGAIAQLVEQRTENPCVPGSIPGGTTFKRENKSLTSFEDQGFFFVYYSYIHFCFFNESVSCFSR